MDYPKFIIPNQMEESISIQRFKGQIILFSSEVES